MKQATIKRAKQLSLNETIEASLMPQASFAQQVEFYVLILARNLAKGKTVGIYTNNRYIFGVAHDFGILWKQRGFLISSRQKIKAVHKF